ncbi:MULTISPECIES: DUF2249 domain-containing protein [Sphingobacterium]|uniref:DUF2249 domain-containing protein n=1 Tax=Sphingobacterium TaxID=28453 RepID=UPI0013DB1547|nr:MULTISPECIES: DUF2249 domain-containing protein [unclassified Sphingobacterium]
MISVNQHTKIAAIIKANPESITAIASLAKPLHKLKNPLLRRLLASRVTIAEAAAMGGCEIADFERVLVPLGFVFETLPIKHEHAEAATMRPDWLTNLPPHAQNLFDVRELIDNGEDPLKMILQHYHSLPEGHALCIVNSFIPYPLISVIGKKGAQYHVETLSPDLHHTWFLKKELQGSITDNHNSSSINMLDTQEFEAILSKHTKKQIITLDVRHLPMPLPMETILQALGELNEDELLYVYHKRVPLHLMEELEDSDFAIRICEFGRDDIRLLIHQEVH